MDCIDCSNATVWLMDNIRNLLPQGSELPSYKLLFETSQ